MQRFGFYSLSAFHEIAACALGALMLAGCASAPTVATPPTAGSASPVPSPPPATPLAAVVPAPAGPSASTVPTLPPAPASAPSSADAIAARLQQFAGWIDAFRATARQAGIRESTLHDALDDASYLPRVVELDRAQPEFTRAVWDYLDGAVTPRRIALGKDKRFQIGSDVDAAAARYGVPASILIAIWGIESNYGGNYGSTPTIDALATLGFDGRREAWARDQLLAALRIIDNGDIDREHMIGSWAGAMGQTQFLPTNFLAYAVDADNNGRRDIWGSMADVTASTANFLAQSGWRAGQPWGVEVRLPPGFDYVRADPSLRQSSAQWATEQVRGVDGQALPDLPEASILLPAGARGPAFLVGPNFRAILRYNNSTSYALAVGLLAQRLDDGPGVLTPWPRDLKMLSRSQIVDLQNALNQRGFTAGEPDGLIGPATRSGVREYQRSVGLPADGYPTAELLGRLQLTAGTMDTVGATTSP